MTVPSEADTRADAGTEVDPAAGGAPGTAPIDGTRPGAPDVAVPATTGSTRRWAQGIVLAAPTVWIAVMAWTHRWMTEDGFIYLRIVRQIRAGNGPVFNEGERVEAYTGSLWVAILSVVDLVAPVRLEWLAIVVGLLAVSAGVALATAAACRLWGSPDSDTLMVPCGIVVFVALFPAWAFATSGLETGLAFAWLGACAFVLAGWATGRTSLRGWHAALIGLGWLVRPELAVYTVFLLLAALGPGTSIRGRRRKAGLILAAGIVPVLYQVFRMGYFGLLVPNTAIAKEAGELRIDRGLNYLTDFTRPYWLWVPAVVLVVGVLVPLLRRWGARDARIRVVLAFLVGSAVNVAYVVAVGGDYHHARLLLPALFAAMIPFAAIPAERRHLLALGLAPWVVIAVVGLRPEQHGANPLANGVLAPTTFGRVTAADAGWADVDERFDLTAEPPVFHQSLAIGSYVPIGTDAAPDLALPHAAMWGIGVSAYAPGTDLHVLDLMGLADSLAAHMESAPGIGPEPNGPGHEKPLPAAWTAALLTAPGAEPDPARFPDFWNPVLTPATGDEFVERVAWARAALGCGPIAELRRSVAAPLTPRRFVANLVRSPRHTSLRIPVDPREAYEELCGPGIPPEVAALSDG